MPTNVEVGSILVEVSQPTVHALGVVSEPYSGNWSLVKVLNGFALDRKIHAAGWHFFFIASEVKAIFFGALEANKIQNALKRILVKVRHEHFNSLEVTGIVSKRFLGVSYATVSAHPRHIQQSCCLEGSDARRSAKRDAEWARG
ncbi:MAG TPA: hypothetical protein VFB28_02325 [Terriglobales bacterium]|nr:hypothetical protein [Terriglobales bacterium]